MSKNDITGDQYIAQQLEALEEERAAIEEQYEAGNISEKEYKTLLAKNKYVRAQLEDKSQEKSDKAHEKTFERSKDMFGD